MLPESAEQWPPGACYYWPGYVAKLAEENAELVNQCCWWQWHYTKLEEAYELRKTQSETAFRNLVARLESYKESHGQLLRHKAEEAEAAKQREKELMDEIAAGKIRWSEMVTTLNDRAASAEKLLAQAEAEKAAVAEELSSVSDQLAELQRSVEPEKVASRKQGGIEARDTTTEVKWERRMDMSDRKCQTEDADPNQEQRSSTPIFVAETEHGTQSASSSHVCERALQPDRQDATAMGAPSLHPGQDDRGQLSPPPPPVPPTRRPRGDPPSSPPPPVAPAQRGDPSNSPPRCPPAPVLPHATPRRPRHPDERRPSGGHSPPPPPMAASRRPRRNPDERIVAATRRPRRVPPNLAMRDPLNAGGHDWDPRRLFWPDLLPYLSVGSILAWRLTSRQTRSPKVLILHVAEVGRLDRPSSIVDYARAEEKLLRGDLGATDDDAKKKAHQCRTWCRAWAGAATTHFADNDVRSIVHEYLGALLEANRHPDAEVSKAAHSMLLKYARGGLPFVQRRIAESMLDLLGDLMRDLPSQYPGLLEVFGRVRGCSSHLRTFFRVLESSERQRWLSLLVETLRAVRSTSPTNRKKLLRFHKRVLDDMVILWGEDENRKQTNADAFHHLTSLMDAENFVTEDLDLHIELADSINSESS